MAIVQSGSRKSERRQDGAEAATRPTEAEFPHFTFNFWATCDLPRSLCLLGVDGWVGSWAESSICLPVCLWSAYLLLLLPYLIAAVPPPSVPLFCLSDCGDGPTRVSPTTLCLFLTFASERCTRTWSVYLPMLCSAPPPLLYPVLLSSVPSPISPSHPSHPPTCCSRANLSRVGSRGRLMLVQLDWRRNGVKKQREMEGAK